MHKASSAIARSPEVHTRCSRDCREVGVPETGENQGVWSESIGASGELSRVARSQARLADE